MLNLYITRIYRLSRKLIRKTNKKKFFLQKFVEFGYSITGFDENSSTGSITRKRKEKEKYHW